MGTAAHGPPQAPRQADSDAGDRAVPCPRGRPRTPDVDPSANGAAPILHLLAGKGVDGRAEQPDQGDQRDHAGREAVENEDAEQGDESDGDERCQILREAVRMAVL
jgi:hypothetical protein